MTISTTQMPAQFRQVCTEQIQIYDQGRSVQVVSKIPDTSAIPLHDKRHWLRIPDVICVFADMTNSTALSAVNHDRQTAGAYQLFTDTAVRLMDMFDAPYIDVRGDGVFALFDSDRPYRALAAAVTFRTFVAEEFTHRLRRDAEIELKAHVGIDCATVLVKKLGMRRIGGRTDRQNEVWAGKPVNMAAKLAGTAAPGQLLVSDRFLARVSHERARMSCGCPNGTKTPLWSEIDLAADRKYDFAKAHALTSCWCQTHGAEFCDSLLALDK